MAALEVEIVRKGRPVGTQGSKFQVDARADDTAVLESRLRGWLEARKYDKALWGQFEMWVRQAGKGKILATVRAV